MSILYKPVLIESAEQAEALPVGTVAVETGEQGQVVGAAVRVRGGWHCTGYCLDFGGAEVLKHSDMIGDTALVPIEAEEEWGLVLDDDGSMDIAESEAEVREWVRLGDEPRPPVHRYVTPWEEA